MQEKLQYASNVLAEIQVSYTSSIPYKNRIKITSSQDAAALLRSIWQPETIEYEERFYVLYLSRSNHVIGYHLHSIGGLAGTCADAKQILAVAIKTNSASIILSHNHPSGNNSASEADREITRKIARGAALLDIKVLDHIILTADTYFSFADEAMMPPVN